LSLKVPDFGQNQRDAAEEEKDTRIVGRFRVCVAIIGSSIPRQISGNFFFTGINIVLAA
jgi:hypothetical protein